MRNPKVFITSNIENKWITLKKDTEQCLDDSYEMIYEIEKAEGENLENRRLSYFSGQEQAKNDMIISEVLLHL